MIYLVRETDRTTDRGKYAKGDGEYHPSLMENPLSYDLMSNVTVSSKLPCLGVLLFLIYLVRETDRSTDRETDGCMGKGVGSTTHVLYRLVGLVVKASASRAGDPGFESRLRRDFFRVESYQ